MKPVFNRSTMMKIEAFIFLASLVLVLLALFFGVGCGHDRPHSSRILSVEQPPVAVEPSWPQLWSAAVFDDHSRAIASNYTAGSNLWVWERSSSFVVAEFHVQTVKPPFAPSTWEPQRFKVRAVYGGNGLSHIPVPGDTINGVMTWYDQSDMPYGTPLPDSLLPVSGTIKAYPHRYEYEDGAGAPLGGATLMVVHCTLTPSGAAAQTFETWAVLANIDSLWGVWP